MVALRLVLLSGPRVWNWPVDDIRAAYRQWSHLVAAGPWNESEPGAAIEYARSMVSLGQADAGAEALAEVECRALRLDSAFVDYLGISRKMVLDSLLAARRGLGLA